jgi:hypothetical protein
VVWISQSMIGMWTIRMSSRSTWTHLATSQCTDCPSRRPMRPPSLRRWHLLIVPPQLMVTSNRYVSCFLCIYVSFSATYRS